MTVKQKTKNILLFECVLMLHIFIIVIDCRKPIKRLVEGFFSR